MCDIKFLIKFEILCQTPFFSQYISKVVSHSSWGVGARKVWQELWCLVSRCHYVHPVSTFLFLHLYLNKSALQHKYWEKLSSYSQIFEYIDCHWKLLAFTSCKQHLLHLQSSNGMLGKQRSHNFFPSKQIYWTLLV